MVDALVATKLNLKLGEQVNYSIQDLPPRKLTIIGILQGPTIDILAHPTMFVPIKVLAADLKIPVSYNVIDLKLKDSAAIDDYDQYAQDLNAKLGKGVDVAPGTSSKGKLGDMTRTLRLFLLILSILSGIAASLIIGTTLSVGVQERVRQFGQLRCIGASRRQLAGFLLGDAFVMLAMAAIAALFLASHSLTSLSPCCRNFPRSISSPPCLASHRNLLRALLRDSARCPYPPEFRQVTRVSPMAAITATAKPSRPAHIFLAAAAGILFLVLQIILWKLPFSRDFRVFSYIIVGVPLIFAGWCLLAPAIITLCERTGAYILGKIFAVQSNLLRTAWSKTPWRAGAMIAALMIGVTLFITVRARGQSIRRSWQGPEIPDLIVKATFIGNFSEHRIDRLKRDHPEISTVIPFDYISVHMEIVKITLSKMVGDDQSTYIAVDPEQFSSVVQLDYIQGDPKTALAQLKKGNAVFVSTEFYNARKLGLGDKVTLIAADGKDQEFTIAAVVNSTGVEVVKNYFDLRSAFAAKAISSMLGTITDAKKYFKMSNT